MYTGDKLSIDHVRVFRLVYYSYISPKLILLGTISKKLLNSGSKYIFISYNNKTTKQLNVYRLDLGYTVMSLVVDINKSKQGGLLNLRLYSEYTQGNSSDKFISSRTSLALLERRPISRPR